MDKQTQDLYTLAGNLSDELAIPRNAQVLYVMVTAFRHAQAQITGVFVPPERLPEPIKD
jgi:hypothetical protein